VLKTKTKKKSIPYSVGQDLFHFISFFIQPRERGEGGGKNSPTGTIHGLGFLCL
jgi:hypothetical protein